MMFEQDNTNFNGECLCQTCMFCHTFAIKDKDCRAKCGFDQQFKKNVGVCKFYIERK